jgi:hypothetical protein
MSGTAGWDQAHIDDLKKKGIVDKNAKAVPSPVTVKAMSEDELQAECNKILRSRGYVYCIAKNVVTPPVMLTMRGWYLHLNECENNPLMPDITVLPYPNDRPALMVELKTKKKFQPGQKELVNCGMWKLAWSVEEFEAILTEWEETK